RSPRWLAGARYALIRRPLARFLDQNSSTRPDWFRQQSETIVGMVAADATEVHIAGFLRTLLDAGLPQSLACRAPADAGAARGIRGARARPGTALSPPRVQPNEREWPKRVFLP